MTSTAKQINKALELLQSGGVICLPTETFYGFVVDATNPRAVDRLFSLKGRETAKPVPLILPSLEQLPLYVTEINGLAKSLIDQYWPGPLNLVFQAIEPSPLAVPMLSGTICLRLASDPIASLVAAEFGKPLVATSANLSGQPPANDATQVCADLKKKIDFIVDDGPRPGVNGSTIVDVTSNNLKILREGDLDLNS